MQIIRDISLSFRIEGSVHGNGIGLAFHTIALAGDIGHAAFHRQVALQQFLQLSGGVCGHRIGELADLLKAVLRIASGIHADHIAIVQSIFHLRVGLAVGDRILLRTVGIEHREGEPGLRRNAFGGIPDGAVCGINRAVHRNGGLYHSGLRGTHAHRDGPVIRTCGKRYAAEGLAGPGADLCPGILPAGKDGSGSLIAILIQELHLELARGIGGLQHHVIHLQEGKGQVIAGDLPLHFQRVTAGNIIGSGGKDQIPAGNGFTGQREHTVLVDGNSLRPALNAPHNGAAVHGLVVLVIGCCLELRGGLTGSIGVFHDGHRHGAIFIYTLQSVHADPGYFGRCSNLFHIDNSLTVIEGTVLLGRAGNLYGSCSVQGQRIGIVIYGGSRVSRRQRLGGVITYRFRSVSHVAAVRIHKGGMQLYGLFILLYRGRRDLQPRDSGIFLTGDRKGHAVLQSGGGNGKVGAAGFGRVVNSHVAVSVYVYTGHIRVDGPDHICHIHPAAKLIFDLGAVLGRAGSRNGVASLHIQTGDNDLGGYRLLIGNLDLLGIGAFAGGSHDGEFLHTAGDDRHAAFRYGNAFCRRGQRPLHLGAGDLLTVLIQDLGFQVRRFSAHCLCQDLHRLCLGFRMAGVHLYRAFHLFRAAGRGSGDLIGLGRALRGHGQLAVRGSCPGESYIGPVCHIRTELTYELVVYRYLQVGVGQNRYGALGRKLYSLQAFLTERLAADGDLRLVLYGI